MEALKFKEAVADLLKVKPEKRDQIDKNILPSQCQGPALQSPESRHRRDRYQP
jgi:hypothetical protein